VETVYGISGGHIEKVNTAPRDQSLHFHHERWPVFYEDNHLLVVYKPAGLIMQRDHKNKANLLDLAKSWIKARYEKPGKAFAGLVQRLDGPVAGVVVVARTSKAASRLSAQIREGAVEKRYLAIVEGRPPQDADRLENILVRDGRQSRIVTAPEPKSRHARLTYRRIASSKETSLLEIDLETGRRHQIRAQLAGIGCPIVGDVSYGASRAEPQGRIALLSRRIAFGHPTRKERMVFQAPTPEGWPWPVKEDGKVRPLWTIEEYEAAGFVRPPV
jgi:23S rRNA pseudouridine1911/1915/1917 synthase